MGLEGSLVAIDRKRVEEIARNFLAQNYAVIDVRNPTLEDNTWTLDADVMLFSAYHIKRVKVDAQTGRILGCESALIPKQQL